ncbi:hypothetical protein [Bacillus rubiinfantis]|uniref:hypothetical protein n=1 Tax=Bacillus rubiinfantis TaxID=1499680 RepID=UPI0005A92482|nr:hypothetical protein [Bacillus rubiinfantis]
MSPIPMLPLLLQREHFPRAELDSLKPSLRPGQVLYGRVEELYHNETALVRFGKFQVQAQLQTPLAAGGSYWFQVQAGGTDDVQLRVIASPEQNKPAAASILREFHLPETKVNKQLLQFFLEKNLPLTAETLKAASEWFHSKVDMAKGLTALEYMLKRDLPLTEQTFQALVAVQEEKSFVTELKQLQQFLTHPRLESFKTIAPLKQEITEMMRTGFIDSNNVKFSSGEEVKLLLKDVIQRLGLTYENDLALWSQGSQAGREQPKSLDSLKPLLMSAMAELGSNGEKLEPLLQRITGMQLISQDPAAPVQQLLMQLPLSFGGMESDVTIQWNGRKKSNGQLDPEHCRVLFFLELQHLNETMIDMVVQNKVVHLTVSNDTEGIEQIVTMLKPVLKDKLEQTGYHLSFIHVKPFFKEEIQEFHQVQSTALPLEQYQGVDIKI